MVDRNTKVIMDNHIGPIYWYANTVTTAVTDPIHSGYHNSLPYIYADFDQDGILNKLDDDDDNDGIPDTWEVQYGLDPFNSNDALLDNDGDGISNLDEYTQGTNPLVSNNVTAIIPIILELLLDNP